jgi:DNA-binding CsgD family transcriptional regulator
MHDSTDEAIVAAFYQEAQGRRAGAAPDPGLHLSARPQQCEAPSAPVRARIGIDLLDRLPEPALLVDGDLTILLANSQAQTLLCTSAVVGASQERLHPCHALDRQRLTLALRQVLDGADTETAVRRRFLQLGSNCRAPLGVYLQSLDAGGATLSALDAPVALATFHSYKTQVMPDPLVVASAFDLSPAETRTAVSIACGATLEEIARARGVTVATIRTQLACIFDKTGTHRQVALASKLLALPGGRLGEGQDFERPAT